MSIWYYRFDGLKSNIKSKVLNMTNCSIYWWLLNKVHQSSEQQSLYNHIHVYHLIFSAEKILISLQWNRRGLLFVDHKNCTLDYVLHQRDDFKLNFVDKSLAVFILVYLDYLQQFEFNLNQCGFTPGIPKKKTKISSKIQPLRYCTSFLSVKGTWIYRCFEVRWLWPKRGCQNVKNLQ